MHKSVRSYRDGYKAHVAVEPRPGSSPGSELTPATPVTAPPASRCSTTNPGLQVLADSAYGSGETRVALRKRGTGGDQAMADWPNHRDDSSTATTSASTTPPAPSPAPPAHRRPSPRRARRPSARRCNRLPAARHAAPPPRRHASCASDRTTPNSSPPDAHWRDGDFADDYRQWRPMVERTIAWLVATRPPCPLPRRRTQPARPHPPRRRHQPAPPPQPRPHPQRRLDPRHLTSGSGA